MPRTIQRVRDRLDEVTSALEASPDDAKLRAERDALDAELDGLNAERDERTRYVREMAKDERNVERPYGHRDQTHRGAALAPGHIENASPAQVRDAALGAIERGVRDPRAQDRLDAIVRGEEVPLEARYLAIVGSEAYASAWRQVMRDPNRAAIELAPPERQALVDASRVMAQRAMSTGGSSGADGGYALPIAIDPTIALTNAGAEDPLRELADVRTITQKTQKLVSSAGVTAAYGAEGSAVATVSPTLAQPEVTAHRATAYVRVSYELFADWRGAEVELQRIFADAKRNLEASKFVSGSGNDEPEGLLTGLTPFAGFPADPDGLRAAQNNLGARWQGNARWLMSLASINTIETYVAAADATEPYIFDGSLLLRKPYHEVSYLTSAVVYGDVRAGFCIADRLGMSVEIQPHAVDSDGVPDGNRGLLAIWRSGSAVIEDGAMRLLQDGPS